jgi:potassium/chloride transporter 4/5/6
MIVDNLGSNYLKNGEAALGQPADRKTEVFQDVTTTFFLLMAIYFPAVTGIFTGTNMSGGYHEFIAFKFTVSLSTYKI